MSDPSLPAPLQLSPAQEPVWRREQDYWTLFCQGDPAALEMVAPEFLGWPHTASAPQDRAALAATLATYRDRPLVPTILPLALNLADDAAVVHLLRTVAGPGLPPAADQVPLRVLHAWLRRDGEWVLAGGMGYQPGKH